MAVLMKSSIYYLQFHEKLRIVPKWKNARAFNEKTVGETKVNANWKTNQNLCMYLHIKNDYNYLL
jgi:hypothetical protein